MTKKIYAALPVLALLLTAGTALASDGPKLQWEKELNKAKCGAAGAPIINVQEKVLNDVDSGQAGNNWAFDNYERHIQVFLQTGGTYCALVSYEGKFKGVAGQTSPGATGVLSGQENGEFEGGYRGIIMGTLKTAPAWPTRGSVGTVDYRCDINANCPGYVSWLGQYFNSGYGFDYNWWGWIYHSGRYGTWINAVTGNSGDILPAKQDKDSDQDKDKDE